MMRPFINESLLYYNSPDIKIKNDTVEFITKPNTDLWQKTCYNFQHDNAPFIQIKVLQIKQKRK